MQEKSNGMIHTFADVMSSSSNNIANTKLIRIDIETDPNLQPAGSKPFTLPLKNHKCARKRVRRLKESRNYPKESLSYAPSIVIVPRKCPSGSPVQETKRRCVNYRKLDAQLPTVLKNKSSG